MDAEGPVMDHGRAFSMESAMPETILLTGISGFIAKESVVSTLQVLLGGAAISSLLTTRSAISFLVFTLLYTPCVAAIATIRRELDSRLKTVGVVVLQCSVAWVVALAAYAIAGLV